MQILKFLGYLSVMLATVPLFGLLVTGSPKQAWRYTKQWAVVVGIMVAAGLLIGGIALLVIPAPT